ncbi:MAG: ATP-dependent helicase [Dorea sp.]|nr:ATP-dependent helicase [Dorea sp.]
MSEWLEKQLEKLNTYQKQPVLTEENRVIVNAHVGSGKTTVLVTRLVYLHEVKQIPYEDMVVLTFTNKAAGEIKERLKLADPMLQEEAFAYMGTFHGVALKLLKTKLSMALENSCPGWNQSFSVITPEEELELANELIAGHGLKIKYKNRLKKRLEQSTRLLCEAHTNRIRKPENDEFDQLQILLNKTKRERNLMSFSDLILTASTLLGILKEEEKLGQQTDDSGKSSWLPAYVLVDEAQDCDEMQMLFLDTLIEEETGFFAVGDPNQTIYSWRGSKETTMFTLKRIYDATEYSLPVNYRSSAVILEASGKFMQSGEKLISDKGLGEQIVVKNHYDPFQEAEYLAQRIAQVHETCKYDYKDIAVFYRLQEQSEIVEKVLEREGIPCHVAVKKTIADIPVLDFVIQLLRFACNPKDELALKRFVTNPSYGPGLKGKKAKLYLEEKPYGVLPIVEQARSFHNRFQGYETIEIEELYDYFLMDQQLHPTSSDYEKDKEFIYAFFGRMLESLSEDSTNHSLEDGRLISKIQQYLDGAALYNMQFFEESGDEVQLMTLHASKGLEFSCVFIIGMNQGLIPLWGKNEAEEEEERRLFFVGMTRAKERLELSYYTNPARQRVLGGPGRYLKMLPYHLLEWKEKKELAEKKAHLQELRKSVMENREKEEKETQAKCVKIRHPRYGIGIVTKEDEMTVTAEFEGYGEKSFMKMMIEYL